MSETTQSFKNHTKYVPAFHFFASPVLAANAIWMISVAFKNPSWPTIIGALTAIALMVMLFLMRMFALTVQDRVIRLEMRLRLRELLPADLQPRIHELTRRQLVALRFASDRELAALTRKVLDDKLTDAKAIKLLIQEWHADHLRA